MNVVAHQDDDLLFLSLPIVSAIRGGLCVRTVYVTAGDANDSAAYWISRENGVKAAYAQLAGVANAWTTADAGIAGHPIPVATLAGARNISLAFMRLPDGVGGGSGGSNYDFQSLQKLYTGVISTITAVNDSSSYTLSALQGTLLALMNSYRPNRIATMDFSGTSKFDHSDHLTVANLVLAAQRQYTLPHTITGFQGYGIVRRPSNVFDPDLTTKINAFLTYAQFDARSCSTVAACSSRPEGGWFPRQYTVALPSPMPGDFNRDGRTDVLARDSSGVLWFYPGNGTGGLLPRVRAGTGWNVMTAILGPGDFNRDGKADVLARDSSGVLWFYPGNGTGGLLPRVRAGTGWNVMTAILGPGDFNRDGKADVLARDSSGVLWFYPGNGTGGLLPRVRAGTGWNVMTAIL